MTESTTSLKSKPVFRVTCLLGHQKFPELCDRQALQEYILLASQDQPPVESEGGLRDKPGMAPDMYHTHYILSGLSIGQHKPSYSTKKIQNLTETFKRPDLAKCILGDGENETEGLERMKGVYARTLGWDFNPEDKLILGLHENEVVSLSPSPLCASICGFLHKLIVFQLLFTHSGTRKPGHECSTFRRRTSDEVFLSSKCVGKR